MPAPFFPNSACVDQANALQTELALSVVRLFKAGFVPEVTTVIADLEAEEADYTTYAPETITAWGEPYTSTSGGVQITAPGVQFSLATTPAVGNAIGGYWVEKAGGEVVVIRQFDLPVSMSVAFDGLVITPTIIFPNGV